MRSPDPIAARHRRPERSPGGASSWQTMAARSCSLTIYVALEWLSFIHEYKGVPITPWNPGAWRGLRADDLRRPGLCASCCFVGVIVSETLVLKTNLQWPIILGIAAIIAAVYAGATALARRTASGSTSA
jgi:hypothetical protein